MLYLLLGIIAVGVLLASQEGKELLDYLGKLALIAGGLYLGYWLVIIIIGLLSDKNIREATISIVDYIFLSFAVCYGLYQIWMKRKQIPRLFKALWKSRIFWIFFIIYGLIFGSIIWEINQPH